MRHICARELLREKIDSLYNKRWLNFDKNIFVEVYKYIKCMMAGDGDNGTQGQALKIEK